MDIEGSKESFIAKAQNLTKVLLMGVGNIIPVSININGREYGNPNFVPGRSFGILPPAIDQLQLTPQELIEPFNKTDFDVRELLGDFQFPGMEELKTTYRNNKNYDRPIDCDNTRGLLAEIALDHAIGNSLNGHFKRAEPITNRPNAVRLERSKRGPGYVITDTNDKLFLAELDNLIETKPEEETEAAKLVVFEVKAGKKINRQETVKSLIRKREALQRVYGEHTDVSFVLCGASDTKIPHQLEQENLLQVARLPYESADLLLHSFMVIRNPLRFIADSYLMNPLMG